VCATTLATWFIHATSAAASCGQSLPGRAALGFQSRHARQVAHVVTHCGRLQMPANKKPRKKYRPKFPPGQIVLPKTMRYSSANELMLKLVPHQELERLRDGTADEGTWHTLTMRLDWGLFMAIDHFEDDVAKTAIREGLEALLSIKDRNAKLAKWGASGSEFKAIGLALNLTDEMQSRTTRREQDDSLQAMLRLNDAMLKEGRSGLVDV
jgi:hypothetical protein